jgi:hypothetical protein
LEHELEWRGKTFSIPVDTEIGFTFDKKDMIEWNAKKVDTFSMGDLSAELDDYVKKSAQ